MLFLQSVTVQKKNLDLDTKKEFSETRIRPTAGTLPKHLHGKLSACCDFLDALPIFQHPGLTLVRNGAVGVSEDGKPVVHWFDGPAMLNKYRFDSNGDLIYSNKFIESSAFEKVTQEGSVAYEGYMSTTNDSSTLFDRCWKLAFVSDDGDIRNANFNVWSHYKQVVAMAETPSPVAFDLETLTAIGPLPYSDRLPKGSCFESAHPRYDPIRRESLNFLVEYGMENYYVLFHVRERGSTRQELGRLKVDKPAYMHDFSFTSKFIILTESPFVVNPIDFIMKQKGYIEHFHWDSDRPTTFTIFNRSTGKLVAQIPTNPFFALHHANAYDFRDTIVLDVIAYPNASIIPEMANKFSHSKLKTKSRFMRYRISLTDHTVQEEIMMNAFVDYPRINEQYTGTRHRFVYLVDPRSATIDNHSEARPIYKIDVETGAVDSWSAHSCSCEEPLFIASPEPVAEDDGMLVSVVADVFNNTSFVIVLDAQTMREKTRYQLPLVVPKGQHGQIFYPAEEEKRREENGSASETEKQQLDSCAATSASHPISTQNLNTQAAADTITADS